MKACSKTILRSKKKSNAKFFRTISLYLQLKKSSFFTLEEAKTFRKKGQHSNRLLGGTDYAHDFRRKFCSQHHGVLGIDERERDECS